MSTLWGTNHQVELVLTPAEGLTGTLGQPAYAVVLVNEETVLVHTHPYLDPSLRVDYDDDTVRDATESLDPWA